MLVTKCCVFWIPSTIHQEPTILPEFKNPGNFPKDERDKLYANLKTVGVAITFGDDNNASFTDLDNSTGGASSPAFCNFEIDPTDGEVSGCLQTLKVSTHVNSTLRKSIYVSFTDKTSNVEKQAAVTLEFIDSCRNGMLCYKYTFEEDNVYELAISKAMSTSVYHLIKQFFHRHEYHSDEKDSLLEAYIQDEGENNRINIKTCDNEPLQDYLSQLRDTITKQKDELQKQLNYVNDCSSKLKNAYRNREGSQDERESFLSNLQEIQVRREWIDKKCYKMLGYSIYFETLLKSWYNSNYNSYWMYRQQRLFALLMHANKPSPIYAHSLNRAQYDLSQMTDAKKQLNRIAINALHAIASIVNLRQNNQLELQSEVFTLQHFELTVLEKQKKEQAKKEKCLTYKIFFFGIVVSLIVAVFSRPLGSIFFCN